jgi:hypothetical protein
VMTTSLRDLEPAAKATKREHQNSPPPGAQ